MPATTELSAEDWHRLNRLLETALALEAEARSAWLGALPVSESDLRPLLQQLLSAQDLTETAKFAAPLPLHGAARAVEEQAGQRLGPYRLLRELGQGGMGTVWLAARADGAFERQVALKLPHAEWIDGGLAQRFARERTVLASLNHPNIAQLLDAGWSESGRPYLALEYVEGEPIHQSCNQKHLDTRARLSLFVAVIRAVAHAHARLVVHRDLKPSNVLVTADGEVKLLDFGIAKLLTGESSTAEETELTRMVGRALTLSYAAPEQILGEPISTAADIYALGVMLFELLTGERPYRLARADAQGRSALEEAIVRIDAPAPSAVAKDTTLRRTLRGDLDAIVLKALKKAPEQRYETAAAFADDIERYLNRLPVRAQRDSRAYRLRRFLVRNRFAVGAIGAVLLALVSGLSVALWQATVARAEAARANTIKDFVLSIIQQADPVASRQTSEADIALLTTAESRIERELERAPELALQMRRAIGAAYRNRGEFKRASQVLRKGIEQARAALPPDNLELIGAFVQIAEEYVIDSRSAWADLDAAISNLRTLGPGVQPLLADALLARHRAVRWSVPGLQLEENVREAYRAAHATGDAGRILEAASEVVETLSAFPEHSKEFLQIIAEAMEYATRSRIEATDPRWIVGLAHHGLALCRAGHPTEGLKLSQEAVAAARTHHGSDSRVTEIALGVLAFTLIRCSNDAKGALEPMREAHAISSRRDPPGSANRELRRVFLVELLFDLELLDEVEPLLRENPWQKLIPGSPAQSPTAGPIQKSAWESSVRLRLGDTEAAERIAEDAVPHIEAEGGQIVAGRLFATLARALLQNGKLERAESFVIASIEQEGKDEFVPTPSRRGPKLLLLGEIHLARGQYESALDDAGRLEKTFLEAGPLSERRTALVESLRGRALLGLGRQPDALKSLSIADAYWRKAEPASIDAARTSYWNGRALIANGDSRRGQALVNEARPKLASSRMPRDRALVADDGKVEKNQR